MAADDRIELRGLHLAGIVGVLPARAGAGPAARDRPRHHARPRRGRPHATPSATPSTTAPCATSPSRRSSTTRFQLLEALAERIAADLLGRRRPHRRGHRRRPQAAPAGGPAAAHLRRADHPDAGVTRAFLGLGSNLGDRAGAPAARPWPPLPDVVAVSPVYETDPVGGPDDQGAYLNLVVELDTAAGRPRAARACAARWRRPPGGCGRCAGGRARSTSTCSGWTARPSPTPTSNHRDARLPAIERHAEPRRPRGHLRRPRRRARTSRRSRRVPASRERAVRRAAPRASARPLSEPVKTT